jgi:hypothetical protein
MSCVKESLVAKHITSKKHENTWLETEYHLEVCHVPYVHT